ncbi:uncharacterized protein MONOS_14716 [Monocercomonoides exilis]|uniref:uncharacterized protein n=1 Tax=Monocercomonoides exilis TaxID=2049356 RepID=UPI003559FEA2|nr:hypothetical protein MONOS_14716 [Monocercomonoides exilis]|eukprot:MONOS_14716.1-p1 / transcript=MONOS_14716.1 / gene=MONOS_14716 / organism=Monocercomonoides_exilis_PA203 / gene_product=unspecified product / transcript_product=unspecified product / location=Mono_scaffold01057:2129-5371(-) / protein_length=1081 / sequence_SO=supercontig / SO=protein_coding / is_pseudo=false
MLNQNISSGDATYIDCIFQTLQHNEGSNGNGGAILFTSSGLLTVCKCSFNDCYSSYCGGAISFRVGGKNLNLTSTSFNQCVANASGGAVDLYYVYSFSIKLSNSTGCTTNHVGGSLMVYESDTQGIIDSCNFKNCQKKTQEYLGGSIGFHKMGWAVVTDCMLCNCTSEQCGGGICWDIVPGTHPSKVLYCFFANNSAENKGHDVFINDGWTAINENTFVLCRSTTATQKNRVVKASQQHNNWIPTIVFHPILVHGSLGLDHEACGSSDTSDEPGRRCKTVGFAVSVTVPEIQMLTIAVEECNCTETSISVCSLSVSVEGIGIRKSRLLANSQNGMALVEITSGKGHFKALTFERNASVSLLSEVFAVKEEQGWLEVVECLITSTEESYTAVFSSSVLNVKAGTVLFDSVEIGPTLLSDVAVVTISAEKIVNVAFTATTMKNIKRQIGNGCGVECILSSGSSFVITDGIFQNCSVDADSASGGGVCIRLKEQCEFVVNGSAAFETCCAPDADVQSGKGGGLMMCVEEFDATFEVAGGVCFSNERPNRAASGKDMFVQCGREISLHKIVSKNILGFVDELQCFEDPSRLCGSENASENPIIPLDIFICPLTSTIHADGEKGTDHPHCGAHAFACSTISYCVANRISPLLSTVLIETSSSIGNEMEIASCSFTLSSSSTEQKNIIVADEGECLSNVLVSSTVGWSVLQIYFSLPTTMKAERKGFISSSSSLLIEDCEIAFTDNPQHPISFFILFISDGITRLNRFKMITKLKFGSSTPIVMQNGHTFVVNSSTVSGISRIDGDGGCIRIEEQSDSNSAVQLLNSSFSSCCTRESHPKGGGMYVWLESSRELTMSDVEFNKCSATKNGEEETEENGLGGGIFIEEGNYLMQFELQNMIFDGCNAWKGKRVFIAGTMLDVVVDSIHFNWSMSKTEMEELDELNGWERATSNEKYIIPLVVYFWTNFSGNGFVNGASGADFSGCGFDVAPCKTIDKIIKLRFSQEKISSQLNITVSSNSSISSFIQLIQKSSTSDACLNVSGINQSDTTVYVNDPATESVQTSLVASRIQLHLHNLDFSLPCSFAY